MDPGPVVLIVFVGLICTISMAIYEQANQNKKDRSFLEDWKTMKDSQEAAFGLVVGTLVIIFIIGMIVASLS